LVSRGNLISQISANCDSITGVIAVQGNLGALFTPASQTVPTRLGGLFSDGPFSGNLVVLGQVLGDMRFNGGLKGGHIAVRGGIAGNLLINGGLDNGAAVVSGGEIGDTILGTRFTLNGNNKGILAAKNSMNLGKGWLKGAVFNNASGINADAIDAIFTDNGQPLTFDLDPLDLRGLDSILTDLAALHLDNKGQLAGPKK
jgi:hypothetical protein